MKILFVSSGNSMGGISPIIKSQGESLIREGVDIDFFTIKSKGFKGYFKSISTLKNYIKNEDYSIIHAHYGLSAIVAFFAKKKEKIVVSFMGDDLVGANDYSGRVTKISRLIIVINKFFAKYFFHYNIVKSKEMLDVLSLPNSMVISNGVDYKRFYEIEKKDARKYFDEGVDVKRVLFCSNPDRPEKNYKLAKEAVDLLEEKNIELKYLNGIEQDKLVYHYNAADCLLLTSFHEGSPNVVKEAMACNIPVVSTKVGDVNEVIGNTEGCYVTSFESKDVAHKLKMALAFNKRTKGREDIRQLEESVVAQKIINIYNKILEN